MQFVRFEAETVSLLAQLNPRATLIREKQLNQALFCLQGNEDCFCLGDFSLIDAIDGEIEYDGPEFTVYLELVMEEVPRKLLRERMLPGSNMVVGVRTPS